MKWSVTIISAPRRGNGTINARYKRRSTRLRINPPRAARTTADRSAGPRRYRLFVHSFSLDRSIITSSALKRDGGLPPLKITLSAAYHGDIAAKITVKVAVLNLVQLLRRSVQVIQWPARSLQSHQMTTVARNWSSRPLLWKSQRPRWAEPSMPYRFIGPGRNAGAGTIFT